MESSPRPTLACLSHTLICSGRVFGACSLLAGHFPACLSLLAGHSSRHVSPGCSEPDTKQGCARLWKFLVFRDSCRVTACVVAGIMSSTTAASRDILLDTSLTLRRLSLAEKNEGTQKTAIATPGCSVTNHVQGGVSTSEHVRAPVIF